MTDSGGSSFHDGFRNRLAAVRSAYAARAKSEAASLAVLAGRLPTDAAAASAVRALAHGIRGTAGTLGYTVASNQAGAIEDAIEAGLGDKRVRELVDCLVETLEKLDAGRPR